MAQPAPSVTADSLIAARVLREQAQEAITLARSTLDGARERYLRDPSAENDAAVEHAASGLRSAERLADAREFQFRSAADLLAAADRERARQDLETAGNTRERIREEVGERFAELAEQFSQARRTIAAITDLVQQDRVASKQANEAAQKAGVSGQAIPISLDSLRVAFALHLSGARHAPRLSLRQDDAVRIRTLLAKLDYAEITVEQQVEVMQLALLEVARVTGGENDLGTWATAIRPLSAIHRGTEIDLEFARARRLLLALPIGERQ